MSTSTIPTYLRTLHQAGLEFQRLRAEMAAFECQHELAAELADLVYLAEDFDFDAVDRRPQPSSGDRKPCWKGQWKHRGPDGDGEYVTLGQKRGGWCTPCQSREKLRPSFVAAKSRLAHLKGALWGFAKREAERD